MSNLRTESYSFKSTGLPDELSPAGYAQFCEENNAWIDERRALEAGRDSDERQAETAMASPWSKTIAEQCGPLPVLQPIAQQVRQIDLTKYTITPRQVKEINELLGVVSTPEGWIVKILRRAEVDSIEQLSDLMGGKVLDYLRTRPLLRDNAA